jgi:hypothetical protein
VYSFPGRKCSSNSPFAKNKEMSTNPKSTEQNSLRAMMLVSCTALKIAFAISVSRRLKGCRDAGGSCWEVGAVEGGGGDRERPTEELDWKERL